jgi:hypothetical protein
LGPPDGWSSSSAEVDDLGDRPVDLVDGARLVGRVGEEGAQVVDDPLARHHQATLAARGVELGDSLAQQGEQQAHVE